MGYINIFLSKEQSICVKNKQLLIGERALPIEDINCLMLDNLQTTISSYAINSLCEAGASIIICDGLHLPACITLPYQGYYKRLDTLELQQNIPKPRQKQLWQQIIKQKISNQGETLKRQGKFEASEKLLSLCKDVVSGDTTNKEAESARVYFQALFGNDFSRGNDNPINAKLNYCYAIIRSQIARHLCARGFECAYGIFHHSKLNGFNLVDDIIEPFRPIVGYYVLNTSEPSHAICPEIKRKLFGIMELEVWSGDKLFALSYAVERIVESLLAYYKHQGDGITMPRIYGLDSHRYE